MSAPAYNKSLTASKNLRSLLASLSVPNIASAAENLIAQLLHYLYTTALALEGTLSVAGASTLTGNVTLGAGLIGSVQALSGAGAVNVTTLTTAVTSTGANALTLANGTHGQMKRVVMVVDGGDATLTPTTKTGYTTIVFNDAGDSVLLQYLNTYGWMVMANNGCTIS